ncbi:hypothetical protein ABZU75_24480 [Streptosporangium sp. NPDC005286]|uniref:hypothetical protein n=1 Tax=Streptosporangium sp. NPDC005286 TaxID=3154463 RepID=UPI0033B0584B
MFGARELLIAQRPAEPERRTGTVLSSPPWKSGVGGLAAGGLSIALSRSKSTLARQLTNSSATGAWSTPCGRRAAAGPGSMLPGGADGFRDLGSSQRRIGTV